MAREMSLLPVFGYLVGIFGLLALVVGVAAFGRPIAPALIGAGLVVLAAGAGMVVVSLRAGDAAAPDGEGVRSARRAS